MPFVVNDGARIHWDQAGSGTPVLLIMGHLCSADMWAPLIPDLTQTHRAIWLDNRGTGKSDTTDDLTVEQMAADALAVLDAAGIERAHVFGASMGGAIAYEFAMSYPERTLSTTLGCTILKTERDKRGRKLPIWLYYLPPWVVKALMRLLSKPEAYGSAASVDAIAQDMRRWQRNRFTARGGRAQNRAIDAYVTTRARLAERMTMPVLVLHGDEDDLIPVAYAKELHEAIPQSELVILAGAGHSFFAAAGEEANRTVIGFIDRVDGNADVR